MTGRFGLEMVIGVLAVTGLWVTLDKAAAGIVRVWWWLRRDRVTPLLEDAERTGVLCAGCAGFEHCDGTEGACDCTCGWPEDWAEDLPPERSSEDLGFAAARERRAPPWEAFQRIQYEAMGFEFPSGLMARVRELTP